MKKLLPRLVFATAAISMAFAPIAAQANTRAGDNSAIYAVENATVVGDDDDDDDRRGAGWLRGVLFAILIVGAIGGMAIVVGDGDNQSPGAN